MRVGVYFDDLSASGGGAVTFANAIARGFAGQRSQHELVLFHRAGSSEINALEGLPCVQIDRFAFAAAPRRRLRRGVEEVSRSVWSRALGRRPPVWLSSPLNRALLAHRIDLLWFPTHHYEAVDIPFIATVWDLQHRLQPFFPEVSVSGALWENRERMFAAQLPRAAYVIVGNETAKSEVMRFYSISPERIRCIEFPTPELGPTGGSSGDVRGRFSIETAKYLFYPAQFWPHKNHVVLLKALRLLADAGNPDYTLVLTGSDKGNRAWVEETAARLGVASRVKELGFVAQSDLVALYRGATALTFASLFGPNNFPPLEAMALECPVLCADVAGMRDQLGDGALYFAPTNAAELARLITKLEEDPTLRTALVERGRQRAARISAADYVRAVLAVFDEFQPLRETWGPARSYEHS